MTNHANHPKTRHPALVPGAAVRPSKRPDKSKFQGQGKQKLAFFTCGKRHVTTTSRESINTHPSIKCLYMFDLCLYISLDIPCLNGPTGENKRVGCWPASFGFCGKDSHLPRLISLHLALADANSFSHYIQLSSMKLPACVN